MPHTLAQKILQAHTDEEVREAGQIVNCHLSGVLANDITGPLAIKSFRAMGATKVFDKDRVFLVMDHFTPQKDIDSANQVMVTRKFAQEMGVTHYYEGGDCGDAKLIAADAGATYERIVRIDVSGMEPQVSCPHLPENTKPVSEVKDVTINQVVIGSCTNGRISDMRDAAEVLKGRKVAKGVRCIVLPATPAIWRQAMKEGLFEIFTDAGCIVGPPTCGPCLGGHMGILGDGERCIATTNRNFRGRMGSLEAEVYLASPCTAAASAVTGVITSPEKL